MGIAKELVDRQHQLLRQRNLAAVPELYTPDAVFLMPGLRVRRHELPALMQAYLAAFPDADNQSPAGSRRQTGSPSSRRSPAPTTAPGRRHLGSWLRPGSGSAGSRSRSSGSGTGRSPHGAATSTSSRRPQRSGSLLAHPPNRPTSGTHQHTPPPISLPELPALAAELQRDEVDVGRAVRPCAWA